MKMPSVKALLLIAGPAKGTRFRPLSLDVAKPLFPLAGRPIIQHHIEALAKVPHMQEILILGFYPNADLQEFVTEMAATYKVAVRYLQEYTALGTAGGIYHFRDRILAGDPDAFFVMNGDVCADFPLEELLSFHREDAMLTMMATEATRPQSLNYGCVVADNDSMLHYVEKPESYVSTLINCGVYVCSKDIFGLMQKKYQEKQNKFGGDISDSETLWFERDILPALPCLGKGRVFKTTKWWSQIKTAGSAIYANRHYLDFMAVEHSDQLAKMNQPCQILGNVFVHPTANVHPTAVLGPNVSIGKNVTIGSGTRVKESIILDNSTIGDHSLILHTVTGLNTTVGSWNRIEGTPNDPNPDKPFAKMENQPLFNAEGKLNPSITILGCNVVVPSEIVVLNSIVLPHKQISHSYKNEIIL